MLLNISRKFYIARGFDAQPTRNDAKIGDVPSSRQSPNPSLSPQPQIKTSAMPVCYLVFIFAAHFTTSESSRVLTVGSSRTSHYTVFPAPLQALCHKSLHAAHVFARKTPHSIPAIVGKASRKRFEIDVTIVALKLAVRDSGARWCGNLFLFLCVGLEKRRRPFIVAV